MTGRVLLACGVALLVVATPAHADQQRCDRAGDWCASVTYRDDGYRARSPFLQVSAFPFTQATICVTKFGAHRRDCRRIVLDGVGGGLHRTGVFYRRVFPQHGRGRYHARFYAVQGGERFRLASLTFRVA